MENNIKIKTNINHQGKNISVTAHDGSNKNEFIIDVFASESNIDQKISMTPCNHCE